MPDIPVIPKLCPRSEWIERGKPSVFDVILFLPADAANAGNVCCYVKIGQHVEASLEFFRDCIPPRTDAERAACDRAVAEYAAHIASLPDGKHWNVRVVKRRTPAMRRAAYAPL